MAEPSVSAKIAVAVLEIIVHEGELGAAESYMFLAFQELGMQLRDYQRVIVTLELNGFIRRAGGRAFATETAKKLFVEARA